MLFSQGMEGRMRSLAGVAELEYELISRKAKPARCGESSPEGGSPSVGNWRTRRGVSPVVATGAQSRKE